MLQNVSALKRPTGVITAVVAVCITVMFLLVTRGPLAAKQVLRNGSTMQLNHLLASGMPANPGLLRRFEMFAALDDDKTAQLGRAMLLAASGQEEAAVTAWSQIPDSARVLIWHGVNQSANDESGLVWFERATAVDPDFAEGWFQAARVHAIAGNTTAAIDAYERAVALAPDDRDAWYELGSVYEATGNLDAARASYKAAAEATVGQQPASNIWFRIGNTYQAQQPPDLAAAAAAYKTGLAVDEYGNLPQVQGLIHTELGRVFARQDMWDAATTELEEALASTPNFYDALLLMADVQWQLQEPDRTFALLQQAIGTNPQRRPAYFRLARYYEEAGMRDEARAAYEQLLAKFPNDERALTAVERLAEE